MHTFSILLKTWITTIWNGFSNLSIHFKGGGGAKFWCMQFEGGGGGKFFGQKTKKLFFCFGIKKISPLTRHIHIYQIYDSMLMSLDSQICGCKIFSPTTPHIFYFFRWSPCIFWDPPHILIFSQTAPTYFYLIFHTAAHPQDLKWNSPYKLHIPVKSLFQPWFD